MRVLLLAAVVTLAAVGPAAQSDRVDWPVYAGDQGATHYSPLRDINRGNVVDARGGVDAGSRTKDR